MKVVIRVRPPNNGETTERNVIKILDNKVLVFDPKEEEIEFYYQGVKQCGRDFLKKPNKDLQFMFDCVFDPYAANQDVHENTTKLILDGLLDGYNCSVFAYGATGAGKTFTMLGNAEKPGITFLTVRELFERIESIREEKCVEVAISYLEIYNENIKDLLSQSGLLQIREDARRGVVIPGLTVHKPKAAEELFEMLQNGNKNRTQHPTDANAESSRSHAVFTVYVKQQDRVGVPNNVRIAKMSLIDLAGSERASMVSKGSSCRLREGANINKSLLALGNCINALTVKTANTHVPYRNSKLTRILKDSLDGNCHTVMIAAVSSCATSYEDTYNTLKYADRAKNIKTNLKQNVINVNMHLSDYTKIIHELQEEISRLKQQLNKNALLPIGNDASSTAPMPLSEIKTTPMTTDTVKLQSELASIFTEHHKINRHYLELTCQIHEIDFRVKQRQNCFERLSLALDILTPDKSCLKTGKVLKKMALRRERLVSRRNDVEKRLLDNNEAMANVEKEIDTKSRTLSELMEKQHVQVVHFAQHLTNFHEHESRCLYEALNVVQRQFLILKAKNMATCDIVEDFEKLLKRISGVKEVAWADQLPMQEDCSQMDTNDTLSLPTQIFRTCEYGVQPDSVLANSDKSHRSLNNNLKMEVVPFEGKTQSPRDDGTIVNTSNVTFTSNACRSLNRTEAFKSPDFGAAFLNMSSAIGAWPMIPNSPTFNYSNLQQTNNSKDQNVLFAGGTPLKILSREMQPAISERRLTFDTPGPSILLNPCDAIDNETIKSESTANKIRGVLSTRSFNNFEPPSKNAKLTGTEPKHVMNFKLKPSSSLSNLSVLKSIRSNMTMSTSDLNKQQQVEGDKVKDWRLNGLKLYTEKRRLKSHPYTRPVIKTISSNENIPPSSAKQQQSTEMTNCRTKSFFKRFHR